MISRRRLYEMFCDLSAEVDILWRELEDTQNELKALKDKSAAKKIKK